MDGMEVEIEIEKEEPKKIEEYEIEQALEDFMRVAKHKKNPELMKKILSRSEEKKKDFESLDELKAFIKGKQKEEMAKLEG